MKSRGEANYAAGDHSANLSIVYGEERVLVVAEVGVSKL